MMRLMLVLLVLGLALGGSGLYLMGFTDVTHSGGITGIGLVVALITLGACPRID